VLSNFQSFKKQLDESLDLVDAALGVDRGVPLQVSKNIDSFPDTKSLLARCESACKKHDKVKPTIRIVHHLACSGGSLISKCISAMPNVYLLSEVHPYTDLGIGKGKPKYAPSDIASLSKYAGMPKQNELAGKLFKNAIRQTYDHAAKYGGTLVLRDHTHADFNTNDPIPRKSSVVQLLESDYQILSILTIRHPIDAYASLVKNGWVHFEPKTFDEYCRRFLLLIKYFEMCQIFRYEDFVREPNKQMQLITDVLDLPYTDVFDDIFDVFKVTGDSGRSSATIGVRERMVPKEIIHEGERSATYKKIQKFLYSEED
jgi:hypothetical protein